MELLKSRVMQEVQRDLQFPQLELLLIKNHIKLPINRSSDKAMLKQELKENSIRNIYLSLGFIFFIGLHDSYETIH